MGVVFVSRKKARFTSTSTGDTVVAGARLCNILDLIGKSKEESLLASS
jgi:hypothetical protein